MSPHPPAETSQVSPGKFAQAALFRYKWDRPTESPWTFPTVRSLFSEAQEAAALQVLARRVLLRPRLDSHPPFRCLLARVVQRLPPSPWNLSPSDDAACAGAGWAAGGAAVFAPPSVCSSPPGWGGVLAARLPGGLPGGGPPQTPGAKPRSE